MWLNVMIGLLVVSCLFLVWATSRFRRDAHARTRPAVSPLRDASTNLPNAILFADRAGQGIQRAKRNKSKFAVVLVEFAAEHREGTVVTSTLHHRMVVEGANRMKATLRASDTLARVGNRFAVGLDLPDRASVESDLQRIHLTLEAQVMLDGAPGVQAAIEVMSAVYPDDGVDVESLFRFAASQKAQRPPAPSFAFEQEIVTNGAAPLSSRDRATG